MIKHAAVMVFFDNNEPRVELNVLNPSVISCHSAGFIVERKEDGKFYVWKDRLQRSGFALADGVAVIHAVSDFIAQMKEEPARYECVQLTLQTC